MQGRRPTAHRLGFAVKVLGDGGLPSTSHDARRWATGPHLRHLRLREQLAERGLASDGGRVIVPAG